MSEPRRKHGWPVWFAMAMFALPAFYIGSFGPACWFTAKPFPGGALLFETPPGYMAIYSPMGALLLSNSPAGRVANGWALLGVRKGNYIRFHARGGHYFFVAE